MRSTIISLTLFVVFLLVSIPAYAGPVPIFSDDFNDGNADGWVFPYNIAMTQSPGGSWSVENGVLGQLSFGDDNAGIVNNLTLSDQTIEAQIRVTAGYAGFALWYQQVDSSWANYVAISNWSTGSARLVEFIDGQAHVYNYPAPGFDDTIQIFHDWRVDADSATGALAVYMDGAYLFTHVATTQYRTGLSGVYSGNQHGYFDDFRITSDDITTVPEPGSTLLLLSIGIGAVSLMARRWK